jgi:hypothetical protein
MEAHAATVGKIPPCIPTLAYNIAGEGEGRSTRTHALMNENFFQFSHWLLKPEPIKLPSSSRGSMKTKPFEIQDCSPTNEHSRR